MEGMGAGIRKRVQGTCVGSCVYRKPCPLSVCMQHVTHPMSPTCPRIGTLSFYCGVLGINCGKGLGKGAQVVKRLSKSIGKGSNIQGNWSHMCPEARKSFKKRSEKDSEMLRKARKRSMEQQNHQNRQKSAKNSFRGPRFAEITPFARRFASPRQGPSGDSSN